MDTVEARTPPEGGSAGGPVYDAFISYSHSADDLLAPRLQSGLQRFAKPWWKRRAVRIFRDETSLSASPHLWSSIAEALDESEWFILLMSPTAAASDWVNKEVEYWLEHKSANRILAVLTEGTFKWKGNDFISDAAPPALHGAFSEGPRWVDLRFARSDKVLILSGHQAPVTDVAFDGIHGVLSASFAGDTRLWNIGPNQPGVVEFIAHPIEERPRDSDAFVSVRFDPSGERLVTAMGHDAAKLWSLADLTDPVELSPVKPFFGVAMSGQFDPDGSRVAIGGIDSDPRVFDAGSGALLMTLEDVDTNMSRDVAFSPDGTKLVTGTGCCEQDPDGTPKIWDLETGRVLARLAHRADSWDVEWSPDGATIAIAGDDALRLWDAETGEERYVITGPFVGAVRFSPDGRLLATGGVAGAALWDAATGEEILVFEGHSGPVVGVAFSPDGSQLVSGSFDTLAKIWDVETGVEIQTLTEHPHAVTGVSWASTGTIATVSDLGDVRLHIRDLEALERIARERLTRSLTEAECRQYLHIEACPAR